MSPAWGSRHYETPHKCPLLVRILMQINAVHVKPSPLKPILILSTHLRLGLRSGLLPICATCRAHFTYLTWSFKL
jgi:hypothetical protein